MRRPNLRGFLNAPNKPSLREQIGSQDGNWPSVGVCGIRASREEDASVSLIGCSMGRYGTPPHPFLHYVFIDMSHPLTELEFEVSDK
jgi:hypothetical protein